MSTIPSPAASPRCSIVIPVFNRAELTSRCLDTLLAGADREPPFEVIVVDDGSTDHTQSLLAQHGERVRVVRHQVNAGFAVSCNDGARIARGEHLVFLNNDTVPEDGWLAALLRYADDHPEAAVVGSKLLFPDGSIQHAGVVICQDSCPRHVYAGFPAGHPAVNKSRRFQIVTAACALFRRSVFEETGGFDVSFVNGYEDADLCLRLGERGHEIHYCHESVVTHLESATRGSEGWTYGLSLYRQRWADRVVPDDLRYYAEDGLMWFEYDAIYPFRILASPELTVVRQPKTAIDDLLDRRAFERQTLLKENIRLTAELIAATTSRDVGARLAPPLEGNAAKAGGAGLAPPLEGNAAEITRRETHALPGYTGERLVSVVVLLRDGAGALDDLVARVLEQRAACRVEIVAVAQGDQPAARARNLAASAARGDICVFLDSDALPADERWLAPLLEALDSDERLAGVSSRVQPGPSAGLLTMLEGERSPAASSEERFHELAGRDELASLAPDSLRDLLAFATTSAAARTEVLRRVPFPETRTSESELRWAKDVLEAGFRLGHEPRSLVISSRERSFLELFEQSAGIGAAEHEVLGRTFAASQVVPAIFTLTREDWRSLEQLGLSDEELEHQRLASALRRTAECVGQWIGANLPQAAGGVQPALDELARRVTERVGRDPAS